ncbi:hypothetical protein ACLOJK_027080 [Asimina triloba]
MDVGCCWVEDEIMRTAWGIWVAMVDAAGKTLPKGFDAGDAADNEGGQPAAMAASLEEDGAPYYGAPAVY